MSRMLIFFGIIGVWPSSAYENHTLVRMLPLNEAQFNDLRSFDDPEGKVEVIKRSYGLNDSLDILVPLEKLAVVENFAKDKNISLEIKHKNYGSVLRTLSDRTPKRRVLRTERVFRYNSYAEIQDMIESIASSYRNLVTLQDMGRSYEGRPMQLVKISKNRMANNPAIFIDAGVHAREWAAPAMALYIIHRLVTDGPKSKNLDGLDWYILPVVNPDGYEYTRKSPSNRMWRKTMSASGKSDCFGVDGNRNYGFKWGVSGVSNNPCDRETYAGPQPFSEPETQIVRTIMNDNRDKIKLYVSLHSYGQYLVYPWGYTGHVLPPTWQKLDKMARAVSKAVTEAGGKPFKVLSAGKWYAAAGGSDDYAFGGVGIPYSYTMEITDGYEFIFPEYLLKFTLPPLFEGFSSFAKQIKREFGHSKL